MEYDPQARRLTLQVGNESVSVIPCDLIADIMMSLGQHAWFFELAVANAKAQDFLLDDRNYPEYPGAEQFAKALDKITSTILDESEL